jgi:hypothetical protein
MTVRRLYIVTAAFAGIGFVWQFVAAGPRSALGFLIGALGSLGNLWLFDWLSRAIAPGEKQRKPWQASLFVGRYIVLIAVGYATVNALGVNPLAVLLGLLISTAAAIASALFDVLASLRGSRSQ